VLLPDGTEFKTWEQEPVFARTYYVDGTKPGAADSNPGTLEQPFTTINRAAQVLQPGDRVVIAAGVYRERIIPARGGNGPGEMISYEAAPGARVLLKGSRVFREQWIPAGGGLPAQVWKARLSPEYFDGYNPFEKENVTPAQFDVMDWAEPLRGRAPCTLPRGLVFQDGRRLTQLTNAAALAQSEGGYFVDRTNHMLLATFFGQTQPEKVQVEIATQETVFAPEQAGLGYIRVKGLTVEHVAGPFPMEQVGAISTSRGHHWILEDNTVRQVNGVGIDVGIQLGRWPQPPLVGFHIVRRNTVTDCGICGIAGLGPNGGKEFGLLIEDNVLFRNAFHDVEPLFETAGIKTHRNVRCLIRRNLVMDTLHGPGIWMDWDNRNSRCYQNIVVNTHTMHGGIFVEASYVPNLVDQNVVWGTEGNGIYEHDSREQIFAHNLVGASTRSGLHLHGKITDRKVGPQHAEYGRHQVRNNLLCQNAKPNVFGSQPSTWVGNVTNGFFAALDAATLELTLSFTNALSGVEPVPQVTFDFFGKPRAEQRATPGPFARIPAGPVKLKSVGDSAQPAGYLRHPNCVRIFNGANFDGWEADPSTWSIVDGAMRGVGGTSRLAYTKADYGSFRLIFTARMNPVNGDHLGVLFWGDRPVDSSKPKIDNAGWIQFMPPFAGMWDYHPPKHHNLPHEKIAQGANDSTKWCTTEILCNLEKGTMRAAVDGVELARYTHRTPAERKDPEKRIVPGPIGLFRHGGGASEYRDVYVEANPKEDVLITVTTHANTERGK